MDAIEVRRTSRMCGLSNEGTSLGYSSTASPRLQSLLPTPQLNTLPPPKTIILGLWPGARDEQIDYYVEGYKSLYPSARVLPLPYSKAVDQIAAALDSLTPIEKKSSFDFRPTILLHLFGNAGATQTCQLLRAFKSRIGHALEVKAAIMDTAPTLPLPSYASTARSPRHFMTLIGLTIFVLLSRVWSALASWNTDTTSDKLRYDLNNADLLPVDATKCYVWPDRDLISTWGPSKHDDDEYEQHDYAVRRSLVDGKDKWTSDQERYWMAIEDGWECR